MTRPALRLQLPILLTFAATLLGGGGCANVGAGASGGRGLAPVRLAGLEARAASVVYVVDTTRAGEPDFAYVLAGLTRSIAALAPGQRFGIVLFGAESPKVFHGDGGEKLVPATPANVAAAGHFLKAHRERGPADDSAAYRAMRAAMGLGGDASGPRPPEAVFLLAQRAWPDNLADRVIPLSRATRTRIYAVGLINPEVVPLLERLAEQTGGQFRFVNAVDVGKSPL